MRPRKTAASSTVKPRTFRKSQSSRAGLILPVARFHNKLKSMPQASPRISKGASVYMTAVIEYLIAEVVELGGNAARDNKRARISPRHLMLAIAVDQELEKLMRKIIIPGSGVVPKILPAMIPAAVPKILPAIKPVAGPIKGARKARVPKAVKAAAAPKGILEDAPGEKKTSKNVTVLNERTLASGQKLTVLQADITNVTADAIIHPTNNSFYLGGEVGSAIARAGGNKVRNIVADLHRTHGNLAVSGVAISDASDQMLCKHIIHVYSPSWDTDQQAQRINDLIQVVNNILTLSETNKLKIVAIPSISSGANGFPKQVAAQTILRAINSYFKSLDSAKAKSTIEQVKFVLYDAESVSVYTSELGKLEI